MIFKPFANTMKKYTLITLCLGILFSSCKKDYHANISTVVKGRFYDSTNKVPFPNITVKVGEYQSETTNFIRYYTLNSYVGFATTDASGNYEINFKTSGHGNYYFLVWPNVPSGVNIVINSGSNNYFSQHSLPVNNIGGSNTCNVYGFKQYYMQVRMIVSNNPLPPLNINVLDALEEAGGGEIYGKNRDTILNIPIKKNENFSLILNIYDPTINKGYFGTPIPFSPITAAGDTVQGGSYNIFPATFK
jgi:hypothetical protein